jgi:hypothetical protein
VNVGTINIDAIIRELTNVRVVRHETAFLYGREKWQGPTKYKPAAIWQVWVPYAKKPIETDAAFIRSEIKTERDCDSADFLIEVPLAHIEILGLQDFVITGEYVARVRERTRMQRPF